MTTIADGSKSLPLLFLGQNTDPHSERGVECPGALPPASDPDLVERALKAKAALGDQVGVGRRGQVPGALHAALRVEVAALAEGEERQVDEAHGFILGGGAAVPVRVPCFGHDATR